MSDSPDIVTPLPAGQRQASSPDSALRRRNFLLATGALVAAYSLPLYQLVCFALQSDLYSHVVLIPFISLFLVWLKRAAMPRYSSPDLRLAVLPLVAGLALLAFRLVTNLIPEDVLAITTLSYVLLQIGLCTLFFGPRTLRAIAFPLCFLVFMAPFPVVLTNWIETELQNHSATAAYAFFKMAGTTVFRQVNYFELPGIKLMVAPECSGIHSTLALFITSLLAGYFFLNSPWRRSLLALVVIPLAILRNGFRVFVIGELCVQISPDMIDSYIHHQGGPIFFALSLIPFFLILWLLKRTDRPSHQPVLPN